MLVKDGGWRGEVMPDVTVIGAGLLVLDYYCLVGH